MAREDSFTARATEDLWKAAHLLPPELNELIAWLAIPWDHVPVRQQHAMFEGLLADAKHRLKPDGHRRLIHEPVHAIAARGGLVEVFLAP
eukprot:scaffold305231_cov30-Tisochrysis_lutea.AAC.1